MPLLALRRALLELGLAGRPVMVAVSGGVDSTALLHALQEVSQEFGLKLSVGHVNHGLRGSEADADERFVRELAARLDLPVTSRSVDPASSRRGQPSARRLTLQEEARRLRYAALRGMAEELGARHLATAHHANDQAETVLLRLLRGTGPSGLAGIPPRSEDGWIVRPWLRVPRSVVETWARERGLSWREDPTNRSADSPRSRLRERWLPALARDFNPRLLRAVGDLAEAQYQENQWLEAEVEREAASRLLVDGDALWIEAKDWEALPEALARRLVRRALHARGAGRYASRRHLERMLSFLVTARPPARLELPGGLELVRQADGFRLRELTPPGRPKC